MAKLDQEMDASKLFLDRLDLRYTSPRMHCLTSELLAHEKNATEEDTSTILKTHRSLKMGYDS